MNYLFSELDEADVASAPAHASFAQNNCDPSRHCEVVGLDFGSNVAHYYMARTGKKGRMPFKQLLVWLLRLPCNTLVVCESAHLAIPQTELSLAQPFTAKQLLKLYPNLAAKGITLVLAPHAHTGRRMRLWVAHHYPDLLREPKKSDASDAMALAIYVDRCNEISLANPYKSFCRSAQRTFGRKVTKLSNAILNNERTNEYKGAFYPQVIKVARKVWDRASFLGGLPKKSKFKFVVTVASTLFSEHDGKLVVLTHFGQPPGRWFWMRNVLRMSAWHHRGGTARSNLMQHMFRPYLQNIAKRNGVSVKDASNKYRQFALHSPSQRAQKTLAMKLFRIMLLECRKRCYEQAQNINAGSLELTDIAHEVICGR